MSGEIFAAIYSCLSFGEYRFRISSTPATSAHVQMRRVDRKKRKRTKKRTRKDAQACPVTCRRIRWINIISDYEAALPNKASHKLPASACLRFRLCPSTAKNKHSHQLAMARSEMEANPKDRGLCTQIKYTFYATELGSCFLPGSVYRETLSPSPCLVHRHQCAQLSLSITNPYRE